MIFNNNKRMERLNSCIILMRVCQKQKTTLNINQELATLVKYT